MPRDTNCGPSVAGGWLRLRRRKPAKGSCRDEVAASLTALWERAGQQVFTVREVNAEMLGASTRYAESTVFKTMQRMKGPAGRAPWIVLERSGVASGYRSGHSMPPTRRFRAVLEESKDDVLGRSLGPLAVVVKELRFVSFARPPSSACWTHEGLRTGFEVVYFTMEAGTITADGTTTGLQDGQTWIVSYSLVLDELWRTRTARVYSRTLAGQREIQLESDGDGHWFVNGESRIDLDGCLDVDLESSALTNALPVHRLQLAIGQRADSPATYVRAFSLAVERLEQSYLRVNDAADREQFDYEAPAFDFRCRLVYDERGLVLSYPGIATRSF
jgi:uncharacterized protein